MERKNLTIKTVYNLTIKTVYKNTSKKHECYKCKLKIKGEFEFFNMHEYYHLSCMKKRILNKEGIISNSKKILKLFNTKYKKDIEEEEEGLKIEQALYKL